MPGEDERFEMLEMLGRGGMGTVWKARDRQSGNIVAIKELHPMFADDPTYLARFEREVEVARRIRSPHVVSVLGFGSREGNPYMVLEYVQGRSLRDLIIEKGRYSWEEAKPIIAQVAEGLRAAHAVGVIHRDIKPANILVQPDGLVKLLDFGIARATDMTQLTGSSTMLGTPAYMAPESATSALSDLYGLGCVIYEMLSGKQPFDGDSQQEIIRKHLTERPALTQIPPAARRIVGELLEKDPTKRPQSATQLLLELETGKTAKVEAAGGSGPNKLLFIGIAAAVVVIAAVAGGIFLLNSGDDGSAKTASSTSADPNATNTSAPRSSATTAASATSVSAATSATPAASGTPRTATAVATGTRAAATPVTAVDTAADQQFVGAICTAGKKFTTDLARITSDPNLSASPSLAATRMAIPFGDFADAFGRAKPPKDLEVWHAAATKQLNDVVAKLKKGDFSVFDAGAPFDDPPPAAADRLDRIALKNQDCIDADFTFSS